MEVGKWHMGEELEGKEVGENYSQEVNMIIIIIINFRNIFNLTCRFFLNYSDRYCT